MSGNHPIYKIETRKTEAFKDQKPGTSGLRKKVSVFQQKNYTENFIQAMMDNLKDVSDCTLVVGGDGRYYSKDAIDVIIKICAANGVKKLIIGREGIFSTPAVSHAIRKYKCTGGIILTASHNPGGINGDFGIKFNVANGGPAPDAVTERIFELASGIKEYTICPDLTYNINDIWALDYELENGHIFTLQVINPVSDYVELMKEIFDFNFLKSHIHDGFNIIIDCMNGVTGPYANEIFVNVLGANPMSVINGTPLEDFGGMHPDPNLTYADNLVQIMKYDDFDFGAAFDGDGDRNMILGRSGFFVTPSDSLAVLANNLQLIPYFQKNPITGFARSMPTSKAIEHVAEKYKVECYEVPTGWKYFGNLMDANKICLCGEESFGTGSNHIREKDGIWAALAWLTIIAHKKAGPEQILFQHWNEFGRNFYNRLDYEDVAPDAGQAMMCLMLNLMSMDEYRDKEYAFYIGDVVYKIIQAGEYNYVDPVDQSVTKNQGAVMVFSNGFRVVFRMSGTGSTGGTARVYLEGFSKQPADYEMQATHFLRHLYDIAVEVLDIVDQTGLVAPTVIT